MDTWEVVLVAEVTMWFDQLVDTDPESANLVERAIDKLAGGGPSLGRPLVDRIRGSKIHNMKELRPGSSGGSELRILFVFDPRRRGVLLVAGDKAGSWHEWYDRNIPIAEARYEQHVAELDVREYR